MHKTSWEQGRDLWGAETTEAPEESAEAPEESTETPEESTEAPEESTEAPEAGAAEGKGVAPGGWRREGRAHQPC